MTTEEKAAKIIEDVCFINLRKYKFLFMKRTEFSEADTAEVTEIAKPFAVWG